MNSGIGFGVPDFGTPERNRFMEQLMRGVEDWLRLPYSDADDKVLTYDSSKAFRLKWSTPAAGGGGSGTHVGGVYRGGTPQATGTGSDPIQWNSAHIAIDPAYISHSTSTNNHQFTVVQAGVYRFAGQVLANMEFSQWLNYRLDFVVNGVPVFETKQSGYTNGAANDAAAFVYDYHLDVDDVVEIWFTLGVVSWIFDDTSTVPLANIGEAIKTWCNIIYYG